MANALKRIRKARDLEFQDRVMFFMWEQAVSTLDKETTAIAADLITPDSGVHADANDLALSKSIFAGNVKSEDMVRVVITNGSIGTKVDADELVALTGSEVTYVEGVTVLGTNEVVVDDLVRTTNLILDSDIEWVVDSENKFNSLAQSYAAADLI